MTRRSGDRARDLTIAALKGDSKLVAGGRKVLALMYGLELCTRGPEMFRGKLAVLTEK